VKATIADCSTRLKPFAAILFSATVAQIFTFGKLAQPKIRFSSFASSALPSALHFPSSATQSCSRYSHSLYQP
jgi:hypothetical protein